MSSLNFTVSLQNIKLISQWLIWVKFLCNHQNYQKKNIVISFFFSFVFSGLPPSHRSVVTGFHSFIFGISLTLFLISRQSNIHVERPTTPSGLLGFHPFFFMACFVTQGYTHKMVIFKQENSHLINFNKMIYMKKIQLFLKLLTTAPPLFYFFYFTIFTFTSFWSSAASWPSMLLQ